MSGKHRYDKKDTTNPEETINAKVADYKTASGFHIKIHGLPPLLVPMLSSSVDYPMKPTYSITTVDGRVEVHEHDEKSIETATPEEKDAWVRYLREDEEADGRQAEIMMNAVIMEAIDVDFTPEELESWRKRQKLIGIRLPDDPEELLFAFKKGKVLGSTNDIKFVMDMSMRLTGVDEETVEAVKSSFPDQV